MNQLPQLSAQYANYMRAWIHRLTVPNIPELQSAFAALERHWDCTEPTNLEDLRTQLWSWVDRTGGPRITSDRNMLIARMILCLAYEDHQELEDMGFFDDLLNNYGISRNEINQYGPRNPPPRT